MQDIGFDWGFHSSNTNRTNTSRDMHSINNISGFNSSSSTSDFPNSGANKKRKHAENNNTNTIMPAVVEKHKRYAVCKRSNHPSMNIRGQSLPIQRGLELMSKQQLTSLILSLSVKHPSIQNELISNIASVNFNSDNYIKLLNDKLTIVKENIPYNKYNTDQPNNQLNDLNDYSFVRLKPFILDFLNCLIDCILDNIPPRQENLLDSFKFLTHCTELVLNLPRFKLSSNNYYYDKCLEQLTHIWMSLLTILSYDNTLLLNSSMFVYEWKDKLRNYNDAANGMFSKPLAAMESLIDNAYDEKSINLNNSLQTENTSV